MSDLSIDKSIKYFIEVAKEDIKKKKITIDLYEKILNGEDLIIPNKVLKDNFSTVLHTNFIDNLIRIYKPI